MFKQGSLDSPTIENLEFSSLVEPELKVISMNTVTESDNQVAEDAALICTCLNLETLRCFEEVEQQYVNSGVIFRNCMAIRPSNPAFPTSSGNIVLLGAPGGGFMEVSFLQPVKVVRAFVTSSQRLEMCAFDRDRNLVATTILVASNLANSNSSVPPNMPIQVKATEITTVTFSVFNGQFTVDDFSFCH